MPLEPPSARPPRGGRTAVLCVGPELEPAIDHLLDASLVEVVGRVTRGIQTVEVAGAVQPDLVIVELERLGVLGTRVVSMLRIVAEGCSVLVLASLTGVDDALTDAGAHAVVATDDLRQLAAAIESAPTGSRMTNASSS